MPRRRIPAHPGLFAIDKTGHEPGRDIVITKDLASEWGKGKATANLRPATEGVPQKRVSRPVYTLLWYTS